MILNNIKDMTSNFVEQYDFESNSKIWFWMVLKDMILNQI